MPKQEYVGPAPTATTTGAADAASFEWLVSHAPVGYPEAVRFMEDRVDRIARGTAPEAIWLLEHPTLYTAGTSAQPDDLLDPNRFPVYHTGRGGRFTYHGPGQRIAYVMLDLRHRGTDVRAFVRSLEAWVISTLALFGISGERREGRVGIWVQRQRPGEPADEAKIAAIGIRVRRWVTFHGLAINVDPDLSHFQGIVPCGLAGHAVTSLADLGAPSTGTAVDAALRQTFGHHFRT